MAKVRTFKPDFDLEHCWSEPGPRKMSVKDRETFVPNRFVRKWSESNEEKMANALKRFKSLKLRVIFQVEEHSDDIQRRSGVKPKVKFDKRWTTMVGKTLFIKKIPNQGMMIQIIKLMQDAAKEAAKR